VDREGIGMGHRGEITMCHFKRPEYTRQAVESLRRCEGVGDYLILPHVEPGDDAVRAVVEGIDFAECVPTFNGERFGVALNTEMALADGFRHADFVVHVEDDVLCAPDALRYFEWCRDRFREDPRVFSVTAYNRSEAPPPPSDWHRVRLRHWFHPLACATWRDRWHRFRGRLHCAPEGWDALLNWTFCGGNGPGWLREAYPALSRAQHIGVVSSLSAHSPEWYREHHDVRHWAADVEVPVGKFHE
jgi:hypothetical protein